LLAQTQKGLFGCVVPTLPPSPQCAQTDTHSMYKHALTYTNRQTRTPPPPLWEILFYVSGVLVDCRRSAINSPVIEAKKSSGRRRKL